MSHSGRNDNNRIKIDREEGVPEDISENENSVSQPGLRVGELSDDEISEMSEFDEVEGEVSQVRNDEYDEEKAEEKVEAPVDEELNEISCLATGTIYLTPVKLNPTGIMVEQEFAEYLIKNNLGYPRLHGEPKIRNFIEDAETEAMRVRVADYLANHPEAVAQQFVPHSLDDMPAPPRDDANMYQEGVQIPRVREPDVFGFREEAEDEYIKLPLAIGVFSKAPEAVVLNPQIISGLLMGAPESGKTKFLHLLSGPEEKMNLGINMAKILSGDLTLKFFSTNEGLQLQMNPSMYRGMEFLLIFSAGDLGPDWVKQIKEANSNFTIQGLEYDLARNSVNLKPYTDETLRQAPVSVPQDKATAIIEHDLLMKVRTLAQIRVPVVAENKAKPAPPAPTIWNNITSIFGGAGGGAVVPPKENKRDNGPRNR